MMRHLIALAAGLVFGFGLCLSHMADPQKVLAFLDPIGHWDPSLALVMLGALCVTAPGFLVLRRWQRRPWAEAAMHWPTATQIDRRLIAGAVLFGMGWGVAGYCPGPALAALTFNPREAVLFLAALIVGGLAADRLVHQP